jgi:DNA-3-methyladenine glycosylase II
MRRILTEADLVQHVNELSAAHPHFQPIAGLAGEVPLRWLDPGFAGLVWVITGQQISVAAGRAIYQRLESKCEAVTPEAVRKLSDDDLRAAGFSGGKIRTVRAVQEAMLAGTLRLEDLHDLPADEAVKTLSAIKGIGPWTAEVYLLFAAGHPDIFPAADIALQEAVRLAFGGDTRPRAKELEVMAQAWSPWRSAAARLLWAYYRVAKNSKSGAPV